MSEIIHALYVDDEPDLLHLGKLFLEQKGDIRVTTVTSAIDALSWMQDHVCDIIVSEYQIPEMDGIVFLKNIREKENQIPFILFTGQDREEVVIEALNNGADYYLQKSSNPKDQFDELSRTIRQTVNKRKIGYFHSLHIFNQIITTANRSEDIQTLLHDILTLTRSLMNFDAGGIYLTDHTTGTANVVEFQHLPPDFLEQIKTVSIHDPPYETLLKTGTPIFTDHYEKLSPERSRETGFLSLASVPLLSKEKIIGALNVISTKRHVVTEQERETLLSIGRELGTTIQRMVHEKDLIQRNEELEAAYEELAGSEEELRHQYDLLAKTAENHQKTIDLLENLIAIAHFPIIVWDSDFNIIRMNHIIERIIGRSAAECVGSSVQSVFLPSQAEHVRRLLETTQSGVKWENVELPVLHQDGTLRTILWNTSTLFDTDGITPIATLAQGNDVTDERRYATEKDAALVEIQKNIAQLAILNDEIRNPLMVIITCADLLGNDELLDQIMVQAQRIDGMVNSLVSRDITARKEAEAVIRENEKRYREIFESLEDLYYETDENGIITVLSPSVRFSGWTAEELIGTPVQELYVHPEDRSLLLSELSKNGFVKDFELLLRKKDGTPIPISLSGSIIERPDGTKGGLRGSLRDITERKQAEQKLISTFQTFQDIVKSIPSGIFIYTFEEPDRLILADGNQEAERLTGITIQDWIGREFNEIWPGARESGLTDAYLNAYHTGILFETEDLYYQDERLRGAFRIKAFPIPENRFVVAFEDVTDKKSYELALAESERNYREIFNSTSEAIMIDDASTGKIIDVNETTLKMYGYDTKEEILAGNIGDLSANIFPYDEAEAQRRIEKCIKEGPQVFEWLAKKKSGENFWVEVSLRRSEIGGRGRILAVVRDITRRKEAEESLRMMNERLLQIDSSTLDAIYAYDNQGRFTHANRALCELLGLSRDEIIGKTHRELGFSEDICNEWDKLHTEVYDSDSTITRETVTPIKNGQDMYFEVILNPIHDETGKIVGISGLTRNITDRKKAEEALYASNQKLRLLTSLTRHDVTNKLTAIQLFHEACLEENDLVKKNEFITFASQATQEAEAIIRFTREYEDFGSVSSRWQQVESLIHHASSEILHNGIVIETRTLTNIQIYADPIIQKVFSTLIENAIRHGADITRIIFTCMPKGQDIIIVCEDDGCGIPVHEKEKIFDHGFGKNTGLGLFLAREILAITGLTIRETGMPGKGARFEILVLEGKWQRM